MNTTATNLSTVFVSDLHLQGASDPKTKAFLSFLDGRRGSISRLVIGGDLFDFWAGTNQVAISQYKSVLDKLKEFATDGVQIDYIEGNHDFYLGQYFRKTLPVNVIHDHTEMQIGNFHVYVAHGDQVNPKDHGYLFLRWFLRTPFTKFLLEVLPDRWVWKLSGTFSHVSRNYRNVPQSTIELFRNFARQKLETSPYDVVVLGHTHFPDQQIFHTQGQKKYYFNTGDWISHFTYLEHKSGVFSLKKFAFDTPLT